MFLFCHAAQLVLILPWSSQFLFPLSPSLLHTDRPSTVCTCCSLANLALLGLNLSSPLLLENLLLAPGSRPCMLPWVSRLFEHILTNRKYTFHFTFAFMYADHPTLMWPMLRPLRHNSYPTKWFDAVMHLRRLFRFYGPMQTSDVLFLHCLVVSILYIYKYPFFLQRN